MMAGAPHNLEAEQALLGAILFENAARHRAGDLSARHFFEPCHARLFEVLDEQIRTTGSADLVTVAACMSGDQAFQELGGNRYLADLVDHAPPATGVPSYARLIKEAWARRPWSECAAKPEPSCSKAWNSPTPPWRRYGLGSRPSRPRPLIQSRAS